MWAFKCALLLLAICFVKAKNYGPYEIDISDISKCDDEGNGDITIDNFKVRMSNKRTAVVSVDVTSNIVIDRNVKMEAVVQTMVDGKEGKYETKPIRFPLGSICDAVERFFPKSYKKLYKNIGIHGCPVPPNTWNVKKFPMDVDIPLPELPYKRFRIDAILYQEGKRLACTRFTLSIVPEGTLKF